MSATFSNSGSQRLIADGQVGSSSHACRVFNVSSAGAGGSEIVLRNGTDASGDIYVQSPVGVLNFKEGILFPDGCYYDHAGSSFAVVSFRNENS